MIALAWATLLLWPVVAIILFQKLSLPWALCATILGGYLLLPSELGIDLPILPVLNKTSIPSLSAAVLTLYTLSQQRHLATSVLPGWIPRDIVTIGLLITLIIGVYGSVATNGDTLVYGPRVIPGLASYDFFSLALDLSVTLIPFFLARRVLASVEGQRVLVFAIVLGALAYSLPALFEVRMSPQLHMKFYGFFPHSFAQHMRQGGFRPIVFLNHGLALGIFFTFALIGAGALFRATPGADRMKWLGALIWLFGTLVLAKSLGALLIALILLPTALFLSIRTQILVAACIAGAVMLFPIMRAADIVPINEVMALAEDISPERASSFNTRIENEEILLAKALERPVFGWGGWGRNRVFNEFGNDLSITDGSWVIEIGTGGWFRYIPIFGLLCWPLIALTFSRRDKIDRICAALALILGAKLVDLIPNSGIVPIIWLMAGSLLGRLEMKTANVAESAVTQAPVQDLRRATVYARDFDRPSRPGLQHTRNFPAAPASKKPPKSARAHTPYTRSKPTTGDAK